jgi:WD40 repeat protein
MQQVFSADGKTLLLTTNSTLRLFDMTTGKEHDVPGHRSPVTPRFSADGRTLFTSCDEARWSWDVSPGKEPALLSYEPKKAWEADCLARSADNRLFLDRSEDRVRVRDTATGRVLREMEGNNRLANSGQFSPDATRVMFVHERGDDNNPAIFRIYQAKTGKASGEFKVEEMKSPIFSPNGRLAAWADSAGTVHLHDAVSGKDLRTLRSSRPLPKVEGDDDYDLLFSPDGELLILSTSRYNAFTSGEERETMLPVRVFQISSGREIVRFYANPDKKRKAHPPSCMACSPNRRLLAVAEIGSGIVRLIEIASGKVRVEFAGHRHGVHGLVFSPDGRTLASGGEDNVVFLWDVTGAKTPAVAEKPLAAWWTDLVSEDAKRAGDAIAGLLRKPEASGAFLQERLHPDKVLDEKHLTRLLAELDGNTFKTRETASRELARLGERAEAALRRALDNRPSLEARRRIEDLLNKLERGELPPETLRTLRAIEVLEHLGTPEARACLETLAKGAPQARLTAEAKRALDRLANRR